MTSGYLGRRAVLLEKFNVSEWVGAVKRYGIESMPDTFLIDRKGRVAAAYMAGLVDRDNIEANIKAILSKQ